MLLLRVVDNYFQGRVESVFLSSGIRDREKKLETLGGSLLYIRLRRLLYDPGKRPQKGERLESWTQQQQAV